MRDKRRLAFWFIELHADPDARAKGGGADKLDDALELTFYAHLFAGVGACDQLACVHTCANGACTDAACPGQR